jgi:uncharacterized protein (DUF2141 family)
MWLLGCAALAATLQVDIDGHAGGDGPVHVWVADVDGWLDDTAALAHARIEPGEDLQASFELPAGRYAVWVLHDRNDNGALDMRWLPFPKPAEPVGVSGRATSMGPPRFGPASFDRSGEGRLVSVTLQ